MQHILKFVRPTEENFQNFRMVSKFWKNCMETNRYYESPDVDFRELARKLRVYNTIPVYYGKYLQLFRFCYINFLSEVVEKWEFIEPLILNNMKIF